MNVPSRVTRGHEKRKATQKYELFKNSAGKTPSIFQDDSSLQERDAYILKLAKQQSSMNSRSSRGMKNSTPDRNLTSALENSDMLKIDPKNKFFTKRQLGIEMQRSSAVKKVTLEIAQNQSSLAQLMPKRIMSGKNGGGKKEILKPAAARVPKDRSALIGLKRTRKSRDQIYLLQKMYEDS